MGTALNVKVVCVKGLWFGLVPVGHVSYGVKCYCLAEVDHQEGCPLSCKSTL